MSGRKDPLRAHRWKSPHPALLCKTYKTRRADYSAEAP